MKYFFTAVLILLPGIFLYPQGIIFEQESSQTPQESISVLQTGQETQKIIQDGESLEEFLKKQEKIWLKEKGQNVVSLQMQGSTSAPSVQSAQDISAEKYGADAFETERDGVSERERAATAGKTKTKPEAAVKSDGSKAAKAVKKNADKPKSGNTVAQTARVAAPQEELPQEQSAQEHQEDNDWHAFFNGLAFTLLLGIGVWLVCKYQ